jgi:hypothetical protein
MYYVYCDYTLYNHVVLHLDLALLHVHTYTCYIVLVYSIGTLYVLEE